jgi:hypothetical protein
MKYFVLCVIAVLAGCAQIQTQFNQQLQTLTEPDLQAAVAEATAANDPNPNHLACYQGLLTGVQALNVTAPPSSTVQPAGVVSGAEALLLAGNFTPITLPTLTPTTKAACQEVIGELVVEGSAASLKAQAAILGTLKSIK